MHKLRLDLDALAVQSFHTGNPVAPVGTVKAHGPPTQIFCTQQFSCATYCGATGCPVQSIDNGCISDPTQCDGCQQSGECPLESIAYVCISDPTDCGCQQTGDDLCG